MCILSQGSHGQGRVAGHSQLPRGITRWLRVVRDEDLEPGVSPALEGHSLVTRLYLSLLWEVFSGDQKLPEHS